jgi:hypothetical protein
MMITMAATKATNLEMSPNTLKGSQYRGKRSPLSRNGVHWDKGIRVPGICSNGAGQRYRTRMFGLSISIRGFLFGWPRWRIGARGTCSCRR